MMKLAIAASAAALALSACSQGGTDNGAGNELEGDQTYVNDVATTNLTMEDDATEVDRAINQTDRQAGMENAADDAANSVSNTVE